MTGRQDGQLNPFERGIRWLGGAVFVAALAFCAFSFAVVWGRPAGFNPSAIAIDAGLFTVFAAHHSVFAREPVKRWLARAIPEMLLRSTYVWISSLLLILVCAGWRTVGGELYVVGGWRAALHA